MGGRLLVHLRLLTSGIQLKKSPMPAILPILPYGAISCCIKTLMRGCGSVRLGRISYFFIILIKRKQHYSPSSSPLSQRRLAEPFTPAPNLGRVISSHNALHPLQPTNQPTNQQQKHRQPNEQSALPGSSFLVPQAIHADE